MSTLREALAAKERLRLAEIDKIADAIDPVIVAEAKADPTCSAVEMAYRAAVRKAQELKAEEAVQKYLKAKDGLAGA